MFDASAKIPEGFVAGNTKYLGQFDECIAVRHPQRDFTGQHCMLNIDINLHNRTIGPPPVRY